MTDYAALRSRMVERQLRRRGIEDERVLAAMAAVPREEFVPGSMRSRAYEDSALPIGQGQTISQPWIVAAICQALELGGNERLLEIGTGSGYSAAVLASLAGRVLSVERLAPLSESAAARLAEVGVAGVELLVGDGSRGVPEAAPFDAIAIHAAAPAPPRSIMEQLAEGGRLVVPIAAGEADALMVYRRAGERVSAEEIGPCRFVPLVGEEGFEG